MIRKKKKEKNIILTNFNLRKLPLCVIHIFISTNAILPLIFYFISSIIILFITTIMYNMKNIYIYIHNMNFRFT